MLDDSGEASCPVDIGSWGGRLANVSVDEDWVIMADMSAALS